MFTKRRSSLDILYSSFTNNAYNYFPSKPTLQSKKVLPPEKSPFPACFENEKKKEEQTLTSKRPGGTISYIKGQSWRLVKYRYIYAGRARARRKEALIKYSKSPLIREQPLYIQRDTYTDIARFGKRNRYIRARSNAALIC